MARARSRRAARNSCSPATLLQARTSIKHTTAQQDPQDGPGRAHEEVDDGGDDDMRAFGRHHLLAHNLPELQRRLPRGLAFAEAPKTVEHLEVREGTG